AKTLATSQVSAAMQIPMGYVYLILPLTGIVMMFYALWFITNGLLSLKQSEEAC
ncbi:MAG: TRAP transporter small permease, partial [Kluyvera intermedia]